MEALREHVRELAAASNDALIIGKLQQETMAKTLTYMQFARKFKAAMVQLRSKELQNRELMKKLDNVTEMLHSVRHDSVGVNAAACMHACMVLFDRTFHVVVQLCNAGGGGAGSCATNRQVSERTFALPHRTSCSPTSQGE